MAHQTQIRALGLMALAALGFVGTLAEVGPVESDLTSRAAAALGGAGLESPALLVAGRDAAISGAASSPRRAARRRRSGRRRLGRAESRRRAGVDQAWGERRAGRERAASRAGRRSSCRMTFTFFGRGCCRPRSSAPRSNGRKRATRRASGRRRLGLALSGGAASIAFAVGHRRRRDAMAAGPAGLLAGGRAAVPRGSYRVGGFAGESISRLRRRERFIR